MSEILYLDKNKFERESNAALRRALLKATCGGDILISKTCALIANSFGFPRAQCVLEVEGAYIAVGRYGWISSQFDFGQAEQKDINQISEFTNLAEEINDFNLWPEELKDLKYLLVAPIMLENSRVGFCGVADTKPREKADESLIKAISIFSDIAASRLEGIRRRNLCIEILAGIN